VATYSSSTKTREILISAAGELAALNGFSNVSIRAVAEKAGQNIGSIHYHFKSKTELFKSVIREAIKDEQARSASQAVAAYTDRLNEPAVQVQAIRALVSHTMIPLRDDNRPWWHCRVIYQTLQKKEGELSDIIFNEHVQPEIRYIQDLFKTIRPELSDDEAFLHAMFVTMPVYFHNEYEDVIQSYLGETEFRSGYLNALENMMIRQTLLLLNLPEKVH